MKPRTSVKDVQKRRAKAKTEAQLTQSFAKSKISKRKTGDLTTKMKEMKIKPQIFPK